jgi:hypothetical protein
MVIGYEGVRRALEDGEGISIYAQDGKLIWSGSRGLPAADRFGNGVYWVRRAR